MYRLFRSLFILGSLNLRRKPRERTGTRTKRVKLSSIRSLPPRAGGPFLCLFAFCFCLFFSCFVFLLRASLLFRERALANRNSQVVPSFATRSNKRHAAMRCIRADSHLSRKAVIGFGNHFKKKSFIYYRAR